MFGLSPTGVVKLETSRSFVVCLITRCFLISVKLQELRIGRPLQRVALSQSKSCGKDAVRASNNWFSM